jgi:trehalose-6-phosphate synthase
LITILEWREKVKFVATLMPSRQDIKIYINTPDNIKNKVETSTKIRTADWEPSNIFAEEITIL